MQAKGANRGEWLQHVCISRVEVQEADVRGSKRPREADEGQKNTQEERVHPLPPNYGVNFESPPGVGLVIYSTGLKDFQY